MRTMLILAAALCASASAQPIELSGTIGALPVFLDLSRNGDTVSGWYFYLKVGKELRLEGKLDRNGFFQLEEYTAGANTRTGSFSGRAGNGHWSGTWKNAAGRKPLAIELDEVKGKLAEVSGRFRCSTRIRDTQFGYTYTHRIDLALTRGRVSKLSLFRSEKSDTGETQRCRIGLGSLKQARSETGILLRARADRADGVQHCTIRILAAGDYLVIKTGDASQNGDDCRSAGGTMFCSARSFWTDLIVNRTTQTCRPVR